jgi:site-specific DNA-cytosine methylase
MTLMVGSLFSGIGGLDIGLERAGMQVIWQSEIDPYACKVLKKHWPEVPNHGDIKQIDWRTVEPVDVICGGYPCQPFSKQESDKEQTTQDTYGHGCEQPLANYDHVSQSWRTLEGISLLGDYKSLESLPKSGMTRNGVLYQQPEWVRLIDANGSLSWPTPTKG